ncbi:MAG: M48 family metalloprotease [Cyanobacteria bacterium P01_A01_bin.105]
MKYLKHFVLAALITAWVGVGNLSLVQAQTDSRFATFIQADGLYRSGDVSAAEQLYRQVKPAFETTVSEVPAPIYDAAALSVGSAVYWNNAQAAIAAGNSDAAINALQLLTESQSEFIPAALQLAEQLQAQDRQDEAIEVLDRAAARYPDASDVVMTQAQTLAAAGLPLESSIAAREFATLYPDHPQAGAFAQLAEAQLDRFMANRQRDNIVTGALNIFGGILTGQRVPWSSWDDAMETYEIINLMASDEKEFGARVAAQYVEQLPLVTDPIVVDYVTQLGLEVARLMGRDFDYEFFVVQDSSINAFALPGGKIFVNTGAILAANSQAELAGVLAHEAAHSVLSHGLQSVFRDGLIAQLGDQVQMGDFVANLLTLHYSRRQERQSDILGTRVLSTAGYAADGLRNFMATLGANTSSSQSEYFSSHPASATRVEYLETLIQRNGYNRYALEGVDRHSEIQAMVG